MGEVDVRGISGGQNLNSVPNHAHHVNLSKAKYSLPLASLRGVFFGRPLMEFLERLSALRAPIGFGLNGGYRGVPASAWLTIFHPIRGCQCNLQFVDLIPLSVSSLPFRDGKKLLKATKRGCRLLFIHSALSLLHWTFSNYHFRKGTSREDKPL